MKFLIITALTLSLVTPVESFSKASDSNKDIAKKIYQSVLATRSKVGKDIQANKNLAETVLHDESIPNSRFLLADVERQLKEPFADKEFGSITVNGKRIDVANWSYAGKFDVLISTVLKFIVTDKKLSEEIKSTFINNSHGVLISPVNGEYNISIHLEREDLKPFSKALNRFLSKNKEVVYLSPERVACLGLF